MALPAVAAVLLLGGCEKNPVDTANVDEDTILFIRTGNGTSEICTMKPDGTDIQVISRYQVGDDLKREYYYSARWSPDKKLIVLTGGPGTTLEVWAIWLLDAKGKFLKKVSWNGHFPIWIDNSKILFIRREFYGSMGGDYWVFDVTTSEEKLYYLQPDSVKIALSSISNDQENALGTLSERTGTDSFGAPIWKTSVANFELNALSNYRRLLSRDNLSLSIFPKWSPDESLISYSLLDSNYVRNLYLMTAEGDSLFSLTNETELNPMAYTFYAWSPDGRFLVYSRPSPGDEWEPKKDIYIHEIETGNLTNLTNTAINRVTNHVMDWF